MANPRNSTTFHALWFTKIAFFCITFFFLCCAAMAAIPSTIEFLFTSLLRLFSAAQPWLSPPYLFITVHLIILIIWKLSDQVKPQPFEPSSSSQAAVFERSNTVPVHRSSKFEVLDRIQSSPESLLHYNQLQPGSPLRRSKSKSPRSAMHGNHVKIARLEPRGIEFELEEMENKFVKKNLKPVTPAFMAVNPVVGEEDSDELNRRFDEFIKKKYNQMRLESFHRRPSETAAE